MTETLDWIRDNWGWIVTVFVPAMIVLASAIVRLTPSPKDDEALGRFLGATQRLSLLDHHDAPQTFKMIGTRTSRKVLGETVQEYLTDDDALARHEEESDR